MKLLVEYNNADNSGGGQWYSIVDSDGCDVLWFPYNSPPEVEQRAKKLAMQFAAAPDLLEALKDCADRLEIHMKHSDDLVAHMKAIAAIAKATGEGE